MGYRDAKAAAKVKATNESKDWNTLTIEEKRTYMKDFLNQITVGLKKTEIVKGMTPGLGSQMNTPDVPTHVPLTFGDVHRTILNLPPDLLQTATDYAKVVRQEKEFKKAQAIRRGEAPPPAARTLLF